MQQTANIPTLTLSSTINEIQNEVIHLNGSRSKIQKLTVDNWQEIKAALIIDPLQTYKEQPTCIEIIDNEYHHRFGTLGNFSAVIGKAKSRKTYIVSLFMAACLIDEVLQEKIKVNLPINQKRLLLFDTEQSKYDVQKVAKRVLSLAQLTDSKNFEVIGARILPSDERLQLLEKIIYDTDDLGVVVIDGIRDLVRDINSPDEATMVTSKLLKWTEERNIHIITILHQNKGDSNARGHVGTEIINKAETVISTEKESDISKVQAEYCRDKDFSPFAFGIDSKTLPYILTDWISKEVQKAKKKLTAYDIPKESHGQVLRDIFQVDGELKKYKDLEQDIKVKFQAYDTTLTNAQVMEFIRYYKMQGYLKDSGTKGRQGNHFSLNRLMAL